MQLWLTVEKWVVQKIIKTPLSLIQPSVFVIQISRFATIMFDVHETPQEHSVKFKNIPGYSNEKFQFKNISATRGNLAPAIYGYAYDATPHIIHRQLTESPHQNSSQCQFKLNNFYN